MSDHVICTIMTPPAYLILAIDTSCDDTSAAIVSGTTVLTSVVASQTQLHKEFGGVFPTVAKQAHKENIQPVIEVALKRAGISRGQLSAVAVTIGPGLAPALEVGISAAQELAAKLHVPLIPINHIEGHLLSVLATRHSRENGNLGNNTHNEIRAKVNFPILSLVISGGHSEFILVKKIGDYQRLGWTQDDAAGEALDKFGRMLDLGYPAGATIEQFAKLGDPNAHTFPLPMTTTADYHLSFSGLKTHARRYIEQLQSTSSLSKQDIYDLCASFQYAVFRHIMYKMNKIIEQVPVSEVWLGGGVAANMTLRRMIRHALHKQAIHNSKEIPESKSLKEPTKLSLRVPYSQKLCSDNAAMIGVAAGYKLIESDMLTQKTSGNLTAAARNIDRRPRWKIGDNL